jgi:lysyl-tRNA synthetase class II
MEAYKRTHTCGELTAAHAGNKVTLNGWVHRNRNHGGVHFINLRDRYGITQVVIDEDASAELSAAAEALKYEYCIAVEGEVRMRPENMINSDMATGEIELKAENIVVLTKCETLPFMIDERSETNEDLRLKYRYLDLRSFSMQRKNQAAGRRCLPCPGISGKRRLPGDRNPDHDPFDSRGSPGLPYPQPAQSGEFLRNAPESPAVQANPDGFGL